MKRALFALIAGGFLSGCTTIGMPFLDNEDSDRDDVYVSVNEGDVLNDSPVVFDKRVSHIVTFDFDSAELPLDAADVVEPHARYLIANPEHMLVLQGNASSEAGNDYNFRLGVERAKAVKGLLLELGVNEEQVIITSVGESNTQFVPNRSVVIGY